MSSKSIGMSITAVLLFAAICFGEEAARIKSIEGVVTILRKGETQWRNAQVNTALSVGDEVYTREESFAEVTYNSGAVLRMAEKTKIIIKESTAKGSKTETPIGSIWVNMKKMFSKKSEFELRTPSATAAIRGTVFGLNAAADSSTDVSVYNGTVAVGPGSSFVEKNGKEIPPPSSATYEVQGPQEIPGPYEVTLEHWRSIVAGQMISVNKDGKFSEKKFDPAKAAAASAFVKKNQALDKAIGE